MAMWHFCLHGIYRGHYFRLPLKKIRPPRRRTFPCEGAGQWYCEKLHRALSAALVGSNIS